MHHTAYRRRPGRLLVAAATAILGWALLGAEGELRAQQEGADPGRQVLLLTVADAIGPATAQYLKRGIRRAAERGNALVIIKLDTPGGLDSAMRDIIREIIASPVPVVTYVAPSGARAASAGTYILYASHVAAMAPGTNLGAATPVQIGGLPGMPEPGGGEGGEGGGEGGEEAGEEAGETEAKDETPAGKDAMTRKLVNDAVAYIRSLARMRGRNADWAERAVREAASLAAQEALEKNVINVVAANERALLAELDGRTVTAHGEEITLATGELAIESLDPGWQTKLLAAIASPNVAYILMLLGIYGLFFELMNPGAVIPGVVGAICLLTAMFALQMLPVNFAGLALVLLGVAFMIGELFVPSFGALGIGGVAAFAIGSLILFETDSAEFRVSLSLVVALTILTAAFFLVAIRALVKSHQGAVVSGREELVGSTGTALESFDDTGQIRVHGEIWRARTSGTVSEGDPVRVTAMHGLTLEIEPDKEARK